MNLIAAKIAACVEYDGSHFNGWQKQPHAPSVQNCIEAALSRVANQPIDVVVAGRTDTGVHATGQMLHFSTTAIRTAYQWQRGCNANLPPHVRLLWAIDIAEDFHARFAAVARRYRYIILNRPVASAIHAGKVTWVCQPLREELMHEAAQQLVGTHDFSAFRASSCQARRPTREVYDIKVQRMGDWIWFDITANAYLHHMVRNIAGSLIAVGDGARDYAWLEGVLHSRDRKMAAATARPDGLYLCAVRYPSEYLLPSSPTAPAFW